MTVWPIPPEKAARDAGIAKAVAHLAAGRLVVIPTETVYGLAADATHGTAVAGIYQAKGRPAFNPLISHVASLEMARRQGLLNSTAEHLAEAFWPGPLTLVLPKAQTATVSDLTTAGLDTVALRFPDSAITCEIIARLGRPIAAPSANRSGRISPTTAESAATELGDRVAMIVDAGPCRVGLESTIVACTGDAPVLLRPGGVSREAIEALLGRPLVRVGQDVGDNETSKPMAPGMLASHYAPDAAVRLNVTDIRDGEALLAFGPNPPAGAKQAVATRNLSPDGDLVEAAANLFSFLRALDTTDCTAIAVAPIPHSGLGEAINDRLARAAAERG